MVFYHKTMITHKKISADLHIFLGCIITLITIGLIFIYSSSSVYALEQFGSSGYFVKKQLAGFFIGLCALIIVRFIPLNFIKKLSPLWFLLSLGLTTLTMVPYFTRRIHGSSRWLRIGGFSFQPSELLKYALIVYLAYLLSKKQHKTSSLLHTYLPMLLILGITSIVLLKQPDFGLTVTLMLTAFALFFIAQLQTKHLAFTASLLIPIGGALIYFRPYRLKRVLTFLNPWDDPTGAGFQIIQSLIAIGSGSVSGVGISHSKQKFFYLPMQHTDFIFSIIAEETGFIGSFFLITLYLVIIYLGMRIAWNTRDSFCAYTILGFVILLGLQGAINLAVATGLVPTKGIGLPFVSYGNTSLVCALAMIGLIINMVHANK